MSRHVRELCERDRRLDGDRADRAARAHVAPLPAGPHQLAARRGHLPPEAGLVDLRRQPAQRQPVRRQSGESWEMWSRGARDVGPRSGRCEAEM